MIRDDYKLFEQIALTASQLNVTVYLVGGYIRDNLLSANNVQSDLDFTVVGEAAILAQKIAEQNSGQLKVFEQFRTAKVIFPSSWHGINELDFVSTRSEIYVQPGNLPTVNPSDLRDDLKRRDFTINTLAIELKHMMQALAASDRSTYLNILRSNIIDQHNGLADLDHKIVKILHANSFIDDPTRIFRAARYVSRIQGALEQNTNQALQTAIKNGALNTISKQRIENELKIIFAEVDNHQILKCLADWGVFQALHWTNQALEAFFSLWSKLQSWPFSGQADYYELFRLTCVLLNAPNIDEKSAEQLLVAPKKIKAWGRNIRLIQANKLSAVPDLFIFWAEASNKFAKQQDLLKTEYDLRIKQ